MDVIKDGFVSLKWHNDGLVIFESYSRLLESLTRKMLYINEIYDQQSSQLFYVEMLLGAASLKRF